MLREPEDHLPVSSSDSIAPERCKHALGIVDFVFCCCFKNDLLGLGLVKETQIEIETNMNIFSVPIILNLKTKQLTGLVKEISEWKVVRN